MNPRRKQDGSAVAVIIIILVLALIAALGWIFWQNFIYKEPVIKSGDSIPKTSQAPQSPKKESLRIEIKEWGVGATYDTASGALQYKMSKFGGDLSLDSAGFVSSSLLSVDDCTYGDSGLISRFGADDEYEPNMTAKEAPKSEGFKKIGSYYYRWETSVGVSCTESKEQDWVNSKDAVKSVFDNLEAQ